MLSINLGNHYILKRIRITSEKYTSTFNIVKKEIIRYIIPHYAIFKCQY